MENNRVVFDKNSTRKAYTPWGRAVHVALLDRNMRHDDLLPILAEEGYAIDKIVLCNLLYGYGVSTRQDVIKAISNCLGIAYLA